MTLRPAATLAADGTSAPRGPGDFLPPETPMAMPAQALMPKPGTATARFVEPMPTAHRRAFLLIGTAAMTIAGGYEMYEVLRVGGVTLLEGLVLFLFVLLFAWIAFSFVSAVAGFAMLLVRRRDALGIETDASLPGLTSRNAMLIPTYNEDPYRIMARLRAIYESLDETGAGAQFDWFVLSDTTDPAIWVAEEKAMIALRDDTAGGRLFYRHRLKNTARKSGNIEDWVQRFGAGYDHMIILDADSLMAGETVVRLVAAMERHAGAGLIQTLPIIVNGRSLFARLQQFAGRLYGPVIAAGIAWWHGSEGNYWGHNAIIRVRAFAEQAGLPQLKGPKPFGGHILSHDFIEAALMRRGGWTIHMAPNLGGSFEECPPSLIDFAARDRRWCQGNLQHLAVLPARGLHWVSRLHLMTGIGSYLTAPLWLIFLMLGILISLQAQFVRPEYFAKGFSLFPQWPAQDPIRAAWVFAGTMGLLIVPKLLAFVLLLTRGNERRAFGGGWRVAFGIVSETLLSGLVAPVMMIFQSSAVTEILLGRDAGWQVQRRDDGGLPVREVLRKYAMPTFAGLAMAVSAYAVSAPLFLWMTPVITGLLLSIPVALLFSRPSPATSGPSLFGTPEQNLPPRVLARANQLIAEAPTDINDPIHELHANDLLLAAHLGSIAAQPSRRRGQVDLNLAVAKIKIEDASSMTEALGYLSKREVYAVLGDAESLRTLVKMPLAHRQD